MDPNSISSASLLSNEPLCNFFSALIGAVVGGAMAIWASSAATRQSHKYDLEKRQQEQRDLLRGFYQALKTEVNVIWERYMWGMGHCIETLEEGQYVDGYYPITQEYFVNYKSNAHMLGQIPDQQLREMIVTTYTKAQGLIDSYRLNNHFNEQLEHWSWLAAETNNPLHAKRASGLKDCLVEYVQPIKELHCELKQLIPQLTELLDQNIAVVTK